MLSSVTDDGKDGNGLHFEGMAKNALWMAFPAKYY